MRQERREQSSDAPSLSLSQQETTDETDWERQRKKGESDRTRNHPVCQSDTHTGLAVTTGHEAGGKEEEAGHRQAMHAVSSLTLP